MSVIEDLDEINRLLSKMKISVGEEIESSEAKIIRVESFEWIEEIEEDSLIEITPINSEDTEELRKKFDEIFGLLEEIEEKEKC